MHFTLRNPFYEFYQTIRNVQQLFPREADNTYPANIATCKNRLASFFIANIVFTQYALDSECVNGKSRIKFENDCKQSQDK